LWFIRRRRQLKNGGPLAPIQQRQQHNLTIGKFQGVMMHVLLVLVDLPKDRGLMVDHSRGPWPHTFPPNVVCKAQLGPRKKANSYSRVFRRGEASRAQIELPGR